MTSGLLQIHVKNTSQVSSTHPSYLLCLLQTS